MDVPGWRRRVWRLAATLFRRVDQDAIGIQAGSLTYGAFLSLPPLLVVLLSIAGSILRGDAEATQRVLDAVSGVIPSLQQMVSSTITVRSVQQLGVGLVGLAGIIWAASGFAARARHALGVVFRTERTGLVLGRFSAGLLGLPIVVLFVLLAAGGSLTAGLRIAGSIAWVTEAIALLAVAAATFVFVLLTYRLLTPGKGPRMREHLAGSAVFTLGWLLLHAVGAEYTARIVSRSTALYGAIGAIFGLLAFLYLTMWWLLLCAELSQILRERRAGSTERPPSSGGGRR